MSIGSAPIAASALGASASVSYQLQVTSGTFTLSMQGAGKLITDIYPSGVFTLDGRAVGMSANRPANFDTGSFSYSGQDIVFDQNFGLIIDTVYNNATFTYSGQSVDLIKGFGIILEPVTFSLTGQTVDFQKALSFSAQTGTFTLSGQDALKGVSEAFDVGSFTYTGQAVTLSHGRFLNVEVQNFTYTFQDFEIKGWFSPTVTPAIWTEVAALPDPTWTDAA